MKKTNAILRTTLLLILFIIKSQFISYGEEEGYSSLATGSGDYPEIAATAESVAITDSGKKVDRYGACRNIIKLTGPDIFAPLKTEAEWDSFILWARDPANPRVKITQCDSGTGPTVDAAVSSGNSSSGSCPFLFTFKNGKYLVENDVMITTKDRYFERAKEIYENNAGDPIKTSQTDLYRMRLIPDTTPEGLRLMVKEIQPEESHVDQVQLIRAVTARGNNLFVDNQSMSIKAIGPVNKIPLTSCVLSTGQDCLNDLDAIDALSVEGKAGLSMTIRFDLAHVNKDNLYLTINSWKNDPPQIQPEPFKANAYTCDTGVDSASSPASSGDSNDEGNSFGLTIINANGSSAPLSYKHLHPRELPVPSSLALGSLASISGDELTIKVEWTAHHVMDHIGLVEASTVDVATEQLSLIKALDSAGQDVLKTALDKDNDYVHLVRGDALELFFKPSATALKDTDEETYFFASSGFFHGLRTFMHPTIDASMESYREELKTYVDELKKQLGP